MSGFPSFAAPGKLLFEHEEVICGGGLWELVKVNEPPYGHYLRLLHGTGKVITVGLFLTDDSVDTNTRTAIAMHIEQAVRRG